MNIFFLSKFEFDFYVNKLFIHEIEQQDLIDNPEIRRQLCHILNFHHIWISRLIEKETISEDWDDLPYFSWQKLNEDNFLQNKAFILNEDLNLERDYINSDGEMKGKQVSDILFHILQHSNYHRAQINILIKKFGAIPVSMNFYRMGQK